LKINLALAVALAMSVVGFAAGERATAARAQPAIGPAQLAREIEHRAEKTSFADLERFGEAAAQSRGPESLPRLQHVAWVLLNQSEFDRFQHFNDLLARQADRLGDKRYRAMARINALKARYDAGDASVHPAMSRIARTEPDWFARIHAASVEATMLVEEDQTGAALKILSETEVLIPKGDPAAGAADPTSGRPSAWR
jgi:hypothetical protein